MGAGRRLWTNCRAAAVVDDSRAVPCGPRSLVETHAPLSLARPSVPRMSQIEVSHGCYGEEVDEETLSQRELRNRSGEVLRRVAAGESFVLTNNGVPVGRLVPLDEPDPPVRFDRPATRVGGWEQFLGIVSDDVDLQATLQELREDRV